MTTSIPRCANRAVADDGPPIASSVFCAIARGLAPFGVTPDELRGPNHDAVSIVHFADVLEQVAARTDTPHLALEIARMLPLGVLGAADYCFSTSATLNDALGSRHIALFTQAIRHELILERNTARIVTRQLCRPRRFLAELSSAFVVRRLRDVLGETAMTLTSMRFAHQSYGSVERYARYFGVDVMFGAATDELAFPRRLVDMPLLTADPILAAILVDQLGMSSATPTVAIVGHVRSVVEQALGRRRSIPTVDDVARRLALSSRSLQRRLREAGMPYSAVVDGSRRDLAWKLLAHEDTVLDDVACRLGFQSVAAFFRAFRRWTGESPRAFQRAMRGAPGNQDGASRESRGVITSTQGGTR
ncbi:MAG TPA: AraC family transcriptional regulator ligand-binding domain-containing protein [Kofleriaceae bacterium]|nr:AraC family transcriptional regulator ligand-binding domain-containing protein [Kofleriaceae bacterium]